MFWFGFTKRCFTRSMRTDLISSRIVCPTISLKRESAKRRLHPISQTTSVTVIRSQAWHRMNSSTRRTRTSFMPKRRVDARRHTPIVPKNPDFSFVLSEGENDFATLNPLLLTEWNYKRNGSILPEQFTSNSHKKVWWKCDKGHEWQSTLRDRNRGSACPECAKQRRKKKDSHWKLTS